MAFTLNCSIYISPESESIYIDALFIIKDKAFKKHLSFIPYNNRNYIYRIRYNLGLEKIIHI